MNTGEKWFNLVAWHILVLGYRHGMDLQTVINHAEAVCAPPDSLYYDYRETRWVTPDIMAHWRYQMFLKLLHDNPMI